MESRRWGHVNGVGGKLENIWSASVLVSVWFMSSALLFGCAR